MRYSIALSFMLCFAPAIAAAQAGEGSLLTRNQSAVDEGGQALAAFQRADWRGAFEGFERAEGLAHSPVFLLYMARAKHELGAWREAQTYYRRVIEEPVAAGIPDTWRDAIEHARKEHAALELKSPSIVLSAVESHPEHWNVTLDGMSVEVSSQELILDPGSHVLVATHSGGNRVKKNLELAAGQKRVPIELSLPRVMPIRQAKPAASQARPSPNRKAPSGEPQGDSTLGYVAGAIGLAGVLAGAVAGTLAWNELRLLEADCDGSRCDPRHASRLESVRRLGAIADVSFAVGAVGLGSSAVLLWLVPPSASDEALLGVKFTSNY